MRQAIVAIIMGIVLLSCTNARVIQYNTERLDNIEEYLRENKFIKPSENVEKLKEEGKIDFSREYRSLEKEAETWKEDTKSNLDCYWIINFKIKKNYRYFRNTD